MPFATAHNIDNEVIVYNENVTAQPTAEWFSTEHWRQLKRLTGSADGRGTTHFFEHNGEAFVLRHYRRGGLPGKILSDQYFYAGLKLTRAWRELHLLEQLQEWGLPAPRPVAARISKHGLYYRSDLITTRIDKARDLHHILCKDTLHMDVWHEIGSTIANFHQRQVFHHDLNIHNIMMDETGKVWLIDFDKCGIRIGNTWKGKNLARLKRSLLKELGKHSDYHFDETCWQQLITGYHANTPVTE